MGLPFVALEGWIVYPVGWEGKRGPASNSATPQYPGGVLRSCGVGKFPPKPAPTHRLPLSRIGHPLRQSPSTPVPGSPDTETKPKCWVCITNNKQFPIAREPSTPVAGLPDTESWRKFLRKCNTL